jgi:hypothetical protein
MKKIAAITLGLFFIITKPTYATLPPDSFSCNGMFSGYSITLTLNSPELGPNEGGLEIYEIGVRNPLLVKVKTTLNTDGETFIDFRELPLGINSIQVHLDLKTKKAEMKRFHYNDLKDNSIWYCHY